jgi:hypothetical protein
MYTRNILSHWKTFFFLLEDEFEEIKGSNKNPYVEEGQIHIIQNYLLGLIEFLF